MADSLESRVIEVIQRTLRHECGNAELTLGPADSMETVGEWDSLSFMSVFCAVNKAFDIDPDFDDAVHYISVASLHRYLATVTR